jgi:2-iminobutanoate/2-iminopropanoate deaminase
MPADTRTCILLIVIAFLAGVVLNAAIAPVVRHTENRVIFTTKAPEPIGPYSQAVRSGDLVFISGQIGIDPATGNLTAATAAGQAAQAMENIQAILQEAGLTFSDVVQARIYLTDLQDFTAVNGVYQQYFGSDPPARATVQVAALPRGARVEIEMVARRR